MWDIVVAILIVLVALAVFKSVWVVLLVAVAVALVVWILRATKTYPRVK